MPKALSRIPTNNGAKSRSKWTKIQEIYENVQHNLAMVLLFMRTVEVRKFVRKWNVGKVYYYFSEGDLLKKLLM